MKFVLSLLVIVSGVFAQAQNSSFTPGQKMKIDTAITNSCGYMRNLTQVNNFEDVVVVDQGIRDVYFITVFEGERRLDQVYFDRYEITVKSVLVDAYDHESHNWGVFAVESVSCLPAP